ncbi:MAG: TetR/AcrR family transcriptional regulator [Nitrospiraceae bacterium]|jgi:AcrR family transcriptional regulator|nr:TetR/AcrR family transcriptional regulator [Nitrospiraceae bacterium]
MRSVNSSFSPVSPDEPPSKQAILREALRLFVRDGLCETSLRDIANATGYSNTVLYKFFESKDALAIHLFERCYGELVRGVAQALSPGHSFQEDLEALVEFYVRFLDKSLDSVLYVHENLRLYWPHVDEKTRALPLVGLLADWIGKGKSEGVVDPEGTTGLLVTLTIGFLGQFARMLYFRECDPPAIQWQDEIKDLLLRALVQKGIEKRDGQ